MRTLVGVCGAALAMSSLLVFDDALALGLGKLRVKSALDEPLVAEIELTSVEDAELKTLKARLSSRQDFIRANVDRPDFLGELKFDITQDESQPLIIITTERAAREPFLHFLVTIEWAGGQLIREYTALLDPPTYAVDIPASVSSPRVVSEEKPEPVEAPDQAATPAAPDAGVATAMAPATPAAGIRSGEYGPTQKGDTLWSIASKLDVGNTEVNVFQIIVALLRENPNAFVNFNINRLKVGQILKLDDISTVAETTKQEASAVYTAHLEEWQAYKLQIAQASQAAKVPAVTAEAQPEPVAAGAAPAPAAAEGVTREPSAAETPAQPGETTEQAAETTEPDVLRIVRANVEETEQAAKVRAAEAEAQALNDQIQLLEETLTSRELENKELRERVAMLESQVEKTNRLIELQSEQLAQMQQQAAAAARAPVEAAAPAAAQAQQAAKDVAKAEVKQPAGPAPEAKPEAAAPKAAEKPKQPAAKPKPKKVKAAAAKPKKTVPWWQNIIDSLFSSWQYLIGLAIAAVALLAGLLQMIRRRRSIAEFEESILTGSVLDGQTETTDTTRASSATDTSFLSDFGMAGMGTVQADEVDPLAESEVYLAYGRDEQAEEVLKEAIKKDSGRHELKLKLLEIYQQRNDLKAFETLAEELYPAGDQGDPVIWQQVVAMGRAMNPHNPLFSQDIPAAVAAAAGEEQSEQLDAGMMTPEVSADASLQPFPQPDGDSNLEAQLDKLREEESAAPRPEEAVVAAAETEPTAAEPAVADKPLTEDEDPFAAAEQEVPAEEPEQQAVDDFDGVDFDLDFEELVADSAQMTDAELAEQAIEDLSFDVPDEAAIAGTGETEQPAANVTPLPGNKTMAPAASMEAVPEPDALESLSQAATFTTSADLEEMSAEGLEATVGAADAPADEMKTNLEELAATVSDMDGAEPAGADDERWDEAATKLDLARAYMDMGDKDGALTIIDEVLQQGNPTQRTQAQELANQLSG